MPRYQLSFSYQGKHFIRSTGQQVVIADSLNEAVTRIMKERNLIEIIIHKRFFYGKPANECEIIERKFEIPLDNLKGSV